MLLFCNLLCIHFSTHPRFFKQEPSGSVCHTPIFTGKEENNMAKKFLLVSIVILSLVLTAAALPSRPQNLVAGWSWAGSYDSWADSYDSWADGWAWAGSYDSWADSYDSWADGWSWAGSYDSWADGYTSWAGGWSWAGSFDSWAD
jgi:hypothetical protein